jgi:hypothetical protein
MTTEVSSPRCLADVLHENRSKCAGLRELKSAQVALLALTMDGSHQLDIMLSSA